MSQSAAHSVKWRVGGAALALVMAAGVVIGTPRRSEAFIDAIATIIEVAVAISEGVEGNTDFEGTPKLGGRKPNTTQYEFVNKNSGQWLRDLRSVLAGLPKEQTPSPINNQVEGSIPSPDSPGSTSTGGPRHPRSPVVPKVSVDTNDAPMTDFAPRTKNEVIQIFESTQDSAIQGTNDFGVEDAQNRILDSFRERSGGGDGDGDDLSGTD